MGTKEQFQKVVRETLGQIQNTAEQYADSTGSERRSRRQLAAATAASLISAGLYRSSEIPTEEEDEVIEPGMTPEEKSISKQHHFIDILLEKLIVTAIPDTIPDKSKFHTRINDPMRKESEKLSLSKFTKNLTQLTAKIGGMFQAQYFFLKIFNWTDPSLTLTSLIVFTLMILHPHLIMITPTIYILYGVMVPAYIYRHPIDNKLPNLTSTKPRGESLIERFARIKDEKKLEEMLQEEEDIKERIPEIDETADKSTKLLKSQMEFLLNMRDLQNATTGTLKICNWFENYWYGTAGFKDERVSTSYFLSVFTIMIFLLLFDRFIDWRIIFIIIAWTLLVVIHPKVLPHIKKLYKILKPHNEKLNKIVKESERNDIIMDELPQLKQIELFEIHEKTPTGWDFYLYSSHIFDLNDEFRRCQKPPPGVSTLEEVSPPRTWRYYDTQWQVDYECQTWVNSRGLKLNKDVFIDINNEFLVDCHFKRRRLVRNVVRYSKPARKPPHLL